MAVAVAEHGLAVHDLRLAGACQHAVLALHPVDDDLEVKLAHAADQGLAGVGVFLDVERGVFLDHLAEREVEPLLRGRVVGFDRLREHSLVGVDPLEQDRRFGSHTVSPVVASLRPAAATISPATALSSRSRLLAWIRNSRATRSLRLVRAFRISAPASSTPEKIRSNTTLRPSSIAILNASA